MRNNDRLMIICGTVVAVVAIASSAAVTSVRALAASAGNQAEQGDTVVYITDGQGSQGVPTYSIPEDAETGELLPNFTPVSMVCYDDAKVERFFRVRIGDESPVRPGEMAIVRADDTHNQRIVDEC